MLNQIVILNFIINKKLKLFAFSHIIFSLILLHINFVKNIKLFKN